MLGPGQFDGGWFVLGNEIFSDLKGAWNLGLFLNDLVFIAR